jgi:hypothetical protein
LCCLTLYATASESSQGLELLDCEPTQMLSVVCESEAALVMDFHAHLCKEEVSEVEMMRKCCGNVVEMWIVMLLNHWNVSQ